LKSIRFGKIPERCRGLSGRLTVGAQRCRPGASRFRYFADCDRRTAVRVGGDADGHRVLIETASRVRACAKANRDRRLAGGVGRPAKREGITVYCPCVHAKGGGVGRVGKGVETDRSGSGGGRLRIGAHRNSVGRQCVRIADRNCK